MTNDLNTRISSFANYLSDNASTISMSASQVFPHSNNHSSSSKNDILERTRRRIEILKERSLTAENEVSRLQQTVMQLQADLASANQAHEKKLNEEVAKHEHTIKRLSNLNKKVVEEKTQLSTKLEECLSSIDSMKTDFKKKLSLATDHGKKEAERAALAARTHERARCERIMQKKLDQVKQETIKGLEPELARLISNHKEAERRLKEEYNREVSDLRQSHSSMMSSELENLRSTLTNEKIACLERERELHRQKLVAVQHSHDDELIVIRRRHQEEIQRLLAENRAQWSTEENLQFKKFEQQRQEFLEKECQLVKKVQNLEEELKNKSEELSLINGEWKAKFDSKLEAEISIRMPDLINQEITQIKSELKEEQHSKLKEVVLKIEQDNVELENQLRTKYKEEEQRLRQNLSENNHVYSEELRELTTKYNLLLDQNEQKEEEINQLSTLTEELRVKLSEKDKEIAAVNDVKRAAELRKASELTNKDLEIERLEKSVQEYQSEIQSIKSAHEEEVKNIRDQLSQVKSAVNQENERKFEELEEMAKKAIENKNAIIKELEDNISELTKCLEEKEEIVRNAELLLEL
ncbi:hypothetical protein P9112_011955 [Eukaryota sp. TZLM1-RC]